MAASRRMRSVANPSVSDRDYSESIASFVGKERLNDVLGPTLASAMHHVTPTMVVRASRLIESLLRKGLSNGVIYPTRFEAALRMHCRDLPVEFNPDVYAHRATEHVRHLFAMLREFHREGKDPRSTRSKTSSFKRACTSSDNVIVKSLVDLMTDDNFASQPCESSQFLQHAGLAESLTDDTRFDVEKLYVVPRLQLPAALPLPAVLQLPALKLPAASDLDDHGYPKIFTAVTKCNMLSGRSASSMHTSVSALTDRSNASIASTVMYDSDNSPVTGKADVASTAMYDSDGFPVISKATDAAVARQPSTPPPLMDRSVTRMNKKGEVTVMNSKGEKVEAAVIDRTEDENSDSDDGIVLDPKPRRRKKKAIATKLAKKKLAKKAVKKRMKKPAAAPNPVTKRPAAAPNPVTTKPVEKAKIQTKSIVVSPTTPNKQQHQLCGVTPDKADRKDVKVLELAKPRMTGPTNENAPRCELTAYEVQADGSEKRVCVWTARVAAWDGDLAADMARVKEAILKGGMTKESCLAMRDLMRK